jgi:membrane protease YdiL (CAAX protease family)
MGTYTSPTRGSILLFGILPPLILNLGSMLLFGTYYALLSTNPNVVRGISASEVQFFAYVLVFVVEWAFALMLIARMASRGISLRALLAPSGRLFSFRFLPALAVFLFMNAAIALYVIAASAIYGQWPHLSGLRLWQQLFVAILIPLTAAFCEELIWRGHLIPEFLGRGRVVATAIVLAAISFASIHGVFLLDKLIMTFVLGLGTGVYFVKQRHLVPLMISHLVADVWTFGLSLW